MGVKRKYKNIPKSFSLLGNRVSVIFDNDKCEAMNALGAAKFDQNTILLADKVKGEELPEDTVYHTYWHEVMHLVLDKMGESELSTNEKFVDLLGGFIYQVIKSSEYER